MPAVKLTVQMPAGVTDVVAHPTKGWKQSVNGRIITWSGGTIPNGAVGKFAFSAHMPNSPGRVLVLPARSLQVPDSCCVAPSGPE